MLAFDEGAAVTPSSFEGFHRGITRNAIFGRQAGVHRTNRSRYAATTEGEREACFGSWKVPSIPGKGLQQGMVRNFYQLCMGKYAGALMQRSRCERQQILWLQFNLMTLGKELAPVEYCLPGQSQPVRHARDAVKTTRRQIARMIASARPEAQRDARRFQMTI